MNSRENQPISPVLSLNFSLLDKINSKVVKGNEPLTDKINERMENFMNVEDKLSEIPHLP